MSHSGISVCGFVSTQWASCFEQRIKMAGNKPTFVICDSWVIPGTETAEEWKKKEATAFHYWGQVHLNSNSDDFLLRKLGFKKLVHLIIGSLYILDQKIGGEIEKLKSRERMQLGERQW